VAIVPDADPLDLDLLGARLDEEDGAVQLLARIDAAAEAVLDARDPDAAVASLDYDSVLDDDWRARLRSGRTQRVLAFTTPSCTVDVEVEVVIERRSMTGQIAPPSEAAIVVTHREGRTSCPADDRGRFLVDDLPAGPVRLSIRRQGERPVETAWVAI
jgi:hypothetical protein